MKKLLFPVIALTLILLMAAAVSASADTIWEIGTNDNSRDEFLPDSPSEILYTVGTSAENFPGALDIAMLSGPWYVDIVFTTTMPYVPVILLYDRAGAEKNELYLDGDLIGDCSGTEGVWAEYMFNIGEILPDTHTLTIECGSGGNGVHWIDWLQLRTVEPTVTTGRSGPDTAYVGELTSWTITITICPDDVVNLEDVVVQGGIGADLVVTSAVPEQGTVTQERKGKKEKGATIVRWDVGTLVSNGCLNLVLTVETGINPKEKQEFTSAELGHELVDGFSATYTYLGDEYKTPETDPLLVDVVEQL